MTTQLQFVLKRSRPRARVSVILLDWRVRESFHSLYYLNRQTVPRELYDLIWIEFYDHKPAGLQTAVDQFGRDGPALDKWIVLGYPADTYFHKHRCYNVGIWFSDGDICVVCDSDAMFSPTFIQSLLEAFDEHPRSAVHVDEVRNNSRRFYPFNYPSIEQVLASDCINWTGTTTRGLEGSRDMLHEANYGACLAARREDLIRIGGADEHIDYLGYICGPYDMTFRLVNAGCRERWLRHEFLYHTWHPGESGINFDYHGPSDGRGMALRALEARRTGRVLPYHENPAIGKLRLGARREEVTMAELLDQETEDQWRAVAAEFRAQTKVQLRQADFYGYDLYTYCGIWYAIPADAGPFDPRKASAGAYENCISSSDGDKLRWRIRRRAWRRRLKRLLPGSLVPTKWRSQSDYASQPELVCEGFWHFNIIRYGDMWYAHRQGVGAFDPSDAALQNLVQAKTLWGLKNRVRMQILAQALPKPLALLSTRLARAPASVQPAATPASHVRPPAPSDSDAVAHDPAAAVETARASNF